MCAARVCVWFRLVWFASFLWHLELALILLLVRWNFSLEPTITRRDKLLRASQRDEVELQANESIPPVRTGAKANLRFSRVLQTSKVVSEDETSAWIIHILFTRNLVHTSGARCGYRLAPLLRIGHLTAFCARIRKRTMALPQTSISMKAPPRPGAAPCPAASDVADGRPC